MRKSLAEFKYIKKDQAETLGVSTNEDIFNICKSGRIIHSRWYYDELTDVGRYIFLDVTDKFSNYLFERIRFVDDLRLKDLFMLVQNNIDFLEPILGSYCRETCGAGLNNIQPYTGEYNPDHIEYLEFYRYLSVENDYRTDDENSKKLLEGLDGINFHGVGFELQDDYNYHAKGTRINWAIGFSKMNEIADTPIRINSTVSLDGFNRQSEIFNANEPRLIDVLRELFYELSWYGNPAAERNE